MKDIKCFNIDGNDLLLDKTLVEYENIPIFFICRDNTDYYLVICVNIKKYNYYIVKVSLLDIYNLLYGNCSMRSFFTESSSFYLVESGETIEEDVVKIKSRKELDFDCLPEEGAPFKILDASIDAYARSIEKKLFSSAGFSKIESDNNLFTEEIVDCEYENYLELSHAKSISTRVTKQFFEMGYNEHMINMSSCEIQINSSGNNIEYSPNNAYAA